MKPTQEQVIAWAREAGMEPTTWQLSFGYEACGTHEAFERLVTLAYEAGRKDENEANKDRIETLYMMYKQASQQRNELAQQQTEALRAKMTALQRLNNAAEDNGEEL